MPQNPLEKNPLETLEKLETNYKSLVEKSLKKLKKEEASNPFHLEECFLIEDSTFKSGVAPEMPLSEWRKWTTKTFNDYLIVMNGATYWGTLNSVLWALQNIPRSRPAFPLLEDIFEE
jgi:hypothetical protein